MTVQAPTIFPFRHDWGQPFKVSREWLTDIITANDGSENRVQLRANPNIAITMRCVFLTEMGAGRLLAQWRGATQPLRYYAPLWCDATDLTSAASAGNTTIFCDITDRPFLQQAPNYVMLWASEEHAEVVAMSGYTTGQLTTAPIVGNYLAAATKVVPVRAMWLTLPVTVTWLNGRIAQADLSFVDQRDQAGLGLSGTDTTATVTSMTVFAHSMARTGEGSTGYVPYLLFVEAIPFDTLGIPIPSAPVTWTFTDNEPPHTGITLTPSTNPRFARVLVSTPSGSITAHAGSVTDTMSVN
jgi:hypothetical protein